MSIESEHQLKAPLTAVAVMTLDFQAKQRLALINKHATGPIANEFRKGLWTGGIVQRTHTAVFG